MPSLFPPIPPALAIVFLFVLGACVGSFLNVVVWRLPRGESLVTPPSHCPKCEKLLPWYDNIPILGWIKLGGRCRFCKNPISKRYPIIEAITALLFVFYYVMFYLVGVGGPCPPVREALFSDANPIYRRVPIEWPMLLLYLFLVSSLLAASLIDAELFIIPEGIPWLMAGVGVLFHALLDHPHLAGALNTVTEQGAPSPTAALAAGGTVGLLISLGLWWRGWLPRSFPQGEPLLEVDDREALEEEIREAKRRGEEPEPLPPPYTKGQIRAEMRKEMVFLLPPMAGAILWYVLTERVPAIHATWYDAVRHDWVSGLLGSLFGGLVGAFVVWMMRIFGTILFGRVAMGRGDVDLMFGVGAILGAGAATVTFFVAPFFGIILAIYMLLTRKRRELPYGPYLSLGAAFVMLFYCPIADYLLGGFAGRI
jgi:leader peptidase (prepilin peptidase)/N-methyltransferase